MVTLWHEHFTSSQNSPPLPHEALVFLHLLKKNVPITDWNKDVQGNPQFLTLLAEAQRAAKSCSDYYSFITFLILHAATFPQESVAVLNISVNLVEDLLWNDIYFFCELMEKVEQGDFSAEDFISTLADVKRKKTAKDIMYKLKEKIDKEKERRGMRVNEIGF